MVSRDMSLVVTPDHQFTRKKFDKNSSEQLEIPEFFLIKKNDTNMKHPQIDTYKKAVGGKLF